MHFASRHHTIYRWNVWEFSPKLEILAREIVRFPTTISGDPNPLKPGDQNPFRCVMSKRKLAIYPSNKTSNTLLRSRQS
jgi:hypothetical protein